MLDCRSVQECKHLKTHFSTIHDLLCLVKDEKAVNQKGKTACIAYSEHLWRMVSHSLKGTLMDFRQVKSVK